MGKVKFQSSWQKSRPWLKPQKDKVHYAVCTVCDTELDISAGICQVSNHEKRRKHIQNVQRMAGQSTFSFSSGNTALILSNKTKVLTVEEQVLKAEIVRCLDIIDSNVSFMSSDNDNDKYVRMFPDSDIAKSYQQKRLKVKYMI